MNSNNDLAGLEFIFSTTVDSHVDNLKSLVKYDTMYSE